MTDFYSQNRCVCSTRSHGPLLCAFCLSFHFKVHQSPLALLYKIGMAVNKINRGEPICTKQNNITKRLNCCNNKPKQNHVCPTIIIMLCLCSRYPHLYIVR